MYCSEGVTPCVLCNVCVLYRVCVTFAGVSLSNEAHHQRGAVGALGRAGERLDTQLVGFGLHTHTHTVYMCSSRLHMQIINSS